MGAGADRVSCFMAQSVLPRILDSMARRAIEAFGLGAAIGHPGESGRAREEVLRQFLRAVVPPDFGIDTGFVIDAVGGVSRQVDIVIYRKGRFPVLNVGGVKYFLVESVAAVLEVKATVQSTARLLDALDHVASVKALDRTNQGNNLVLPHLLPLDTAVITSQIFGAVVSGESLQPDTCRDVIADWVVERPRQAWPNTFVDIAGYQIQYLWSEHGAHQRGDNPMKAEAIQAFRGLEKQWGMAPPLAFFAIDLIDFLRVTPVIEYAPGGYFYRTMIPEGDAVVVGDDDT